MFIGMRPNTATHGEQPTGPQIIQDALLINPEPGTELTHHPQGRIAFRYLWRGEGFTSVMFRRKDAWNYWRFYIDPRGRASLAVVRDGVTEIMAGGDGLLTRGEEVRVEIILDKHFKIFVNETLLIMLIDQEHDDATGLRIDMMRDGQITELQCTHWWKEAT